jgi:hypothetical protein
MVKRIFEEESVIKAIIVPLRRGLTGCSTGLQPASRLAAC